VICPGFVDTPLTEGFEGPARHAFLDRYQPLQGMTTPEEVAALAVYLAGDAARMITGQSFVIDAGQQAGLFT
jgi:2-keto-3-deoxy-L-fuconate dehydrogenase